MAIPEEWWRLYRDPDLDELVATANASNQTLRQAVARVDEARALARVAASYRYPTITLDPVVSRQRTSGNRASTLTGAPVQSAATFNDWLVPFDLTYEVDVWGRIRRSLQAASAQAAASVDEEAVIRLAVQTDVAQYYYTLRLLDAQLDILTRTIVSYQEQVRLLGVQVRTGLASSIVLNQAEAQLQATLAQQQDVARARADEEHALAISVWKAGAFVQCAAQSVARRFAARGSPRPASRGARPPSGCRGSGAEHRGHQRARGRGDGRFASAVHLDELRGFRECRDPVPVRLAERPGVDRAGHHGADLRGRQAQGEPPRGPGAVPSRRWRPTSTRC